MRKMIRRKVRGYWSIDKLKEEALKYKTRGEFQKFSLSAYSIAHKNGWLDDVCLVDIGLLIKLKKRH